MVLRCTMEKLMLLWLEIISLRLLAIYIIDKWVEWANDLNICGTADFDLTGQLVWPGAMLMNDYISKNAELLQGSSIVELGSGVGKFSVNSFTCDLVYLMKSNSKVFPLTG